MSSAPTPNAEGRFPAIVMYHPYRKDDVGRGGVGEHYYFAERGFVSVRLDARGTGTSEGVNTDEYVPQEQEDGYDAVEWLARQPWSNGNVGMYGVSYSGFTSLQVASHRPPHLKAIVPVYATDDRYTDDCHYDRGGNMRMYYDVGHYGGWMVAMNALPPLPELAGPRWAELWKDRLEHNEPYLFKWLKQQVSLHAVLTTPVDRTGACRFLPYSRGLPRLTGGSASTTSLSRPSQASLALRPAGLLARPKADFCPEASTRPVTRPAPPGCSSESITHLGTPIAPAEILRPSAMTLPPLHD